MNSNYPKERAKELVELIKTTVCEALDEYAIDCHIEQSIENAATIEPAKLGHFVTKLKWVPLAEIELACQTCLVWGRRPRPEGKGYYYSFAAGYYDGDWHDMHSWLSDYEITHVAEVVEGPQCSST